MKAKICVLLLAAAFLPRLACAQPPEKTAEAPPYGMSTPEETVRGFLDALEQAKFSVMWKYVLDAKPGQQLPMEYQQLARGAFQIKVESLNAVPQGDWAYVGLRGQLISADAASHEVVPVASSLLLFQRDGAWQIVPASPRTLDDMNGNLLLQLATFIIHPEAWEPLRQKAIATSSLSNMKQIYLATAQSVQDNGGKLLLRAETYAEQLQPYIKNDAVFDLPRTEPKKRYAFNGSLTGVAFDQIEQPAQTVLFYTGQDGKLDFPYQDQAAIAFADGHTALVSRDEAKQLRWKP
jgi:hypothetical protein